uniref:Autism susceptibility gene 2 protein n=1 Tax=Cacopsylla melanoneura TaxID=428564 RepID=A0A8D8UWW1_9HEMI
MSSTAHSSSRLTSRSPSSTTLSSSHKPPPPGGGGGSHPPPGSHQLSHPPHPHSQSPVSTPSGGVPPGGPGGPPPTSCVSSIASQSSQMSQSLGVSSASAGPVSSLSRLVHSPRDMSPTSSNRGNGDNSYSSSVSSLSRSSSGVLTTPTIRHTPPPTGPPLGVGAPPHSQSSLVPSSYPSSKPPPPVMSSTPPVWVSSSSGVSSISSPLSSVPSVHPTPSRGTPTQQSYLTPLGAPESHPSVQQQQQVQPAPPNSSAPPPSVGGGVPPPIVAAPPAPPSVVQANPNPFSAESLFQTHNHTDLLRRELDSRFLASSGDPHHRPGLGAVPGAPPTVSSVSPYNLRTEMHHHQHQHTHVHQHAPLMPPPPLGAAGLYPPGLFKDIPKLGGVDSPFYRHSLALSTYPPGFGLHHPGLTPAPHTATPFAPPNQYTSFTPKQLTEPPKPKPMKTGKWNAMHVRIAWEIYNHQQKALAQESKGLKASTLPSASDLLRPPTHLLPPGPGRGPTDRVGGPLGHPGHYDTSGGGGGPPPPSAASVLSPFSSLNMFSRYGPSVPSFPPLSSFTSSPLTDPWSRLQASRPLPYSTPAPPPTSTSSSPWSLKPDPVELEREKERERERDKERERIRDRERVRREDKQRRLLQQQQQQATQQKNAAAAAQQLHRDRSPLRTSPHPSLSSSHPSLSSSHPSLTSSHPSLSSSKAPTSQEEQDAVMMQMSRAGLMAPYGLGSRSSGLPPSPSSRVGPGPPPGSLTGHHPGLHHSSPGSRGVVSGYPPPPTPWDAFRYDPLRYNPLMAAAFQREEEERAKLFGAQFVPPGAHLRPGPGKVPSPATSRMMGGPPPQDIKKEETTAAGPGR